MISPDGPVRPSSPVVSLQTITPSSPSPPTSSSPSSHYSPHPTTVSREPLPDNAATPAASSFPSVSHSPSAPLTPSSSAPPAAPPPPPPPPPGETPREYPQLQPPIAFAEDPSLAPLSPASLASSASSLVDEDSLLVPRDLDRYVVFVYLSLSAGALSASCFILASSFTLDIDSSLLLPLLSHPKTLFTSDQLLITDWRALVDSPIVVPPQIILPPHRPQSTTLTTVHNSRMGSNSIAVSSANRSSPCSPPRQQAITATSPRWPCTHLKTAARLPSV